MPTSVPKRLKVAPSGDVINIYDSDSIASGSSQIVLTYTVPTGKTFYLILSEFGGSNIARYSIKLNSVEIGFKRTYFGSAMFAELYFDSLKVVAGDVIDVVVNNFRPSPADFEARLLGVLE